MNEGTTATIKIANSTITPLILFKKMSSPRSSWKVRHRGRIFWFRYKHCDVLEEGRHPFQTCVYYVQVDDRGLYQPHGSNLDGYSFISLYVFTFGEAIRFTF